MDIVKASLFSLVIDVRVILHQVFGIEIILWTKFIKPGLHSSFVVMNVNVCKLIQQTSKVSSQSRCDIDFY